jgi:release factor glutamine methyltransferase
VYAPAADSELLLEIFAKHGPVERATVLDLCCGSGVQGIAAALRGHCVDAVDAEHRAVISARRNALLNGVEMAVRQGDLFEPIAGRRYAHIVANPPYMPTPQTGIVRRFGWSDGGPDGRNVIDRICDQVREFLDPGGSLWMVQSSLAATDRTIARLEHAGLAVQILAERKEPFGPISLERRSYLQANDFAEHSDSSEILTVLRATAD